MMIGSHSNTIAWKMLVHHKGRLALSLCGIAFSVLILFMGIGFFNGLNDSQSNIAPILNADLVMLHNKTRTVSSFRSLRRTRLYQALAFDEITAVLPVYKGQVGIVNPQTQMKKTIFYLAFPAGSHPFLIPGMADHEEKLKKKGAVLFDSLSRDIFGTFQTGMEIEISDEKFYVAGMVQLGPNFAHHGYVLMSDTTLSTIRDRWFLEEISFGLIRAKPGADISVLKKKLLSLSPDDFLVMTPEELRRREIAYTTHATPVGALLGIGLIVGFVIGIIISYQILFNEVTDHMPQFATLKAIGFSKKFLVAIVMKVALLLSVVGFFPGLLCGYLLYITIEHYTKIVMFLTGFRVSCIFFLTIFMCSIAGFMAVKKVLAADPAELF